MDYSFFIPKMFPKQFKNTSFADYFDVLNTKKKKIILFIISLFVFIG